MLLPAGTGRYHGSIIDGLGQFKETTIIHEKDKLKTPNYAGFTAFDSPFGKEKYHCFLSRLQIFSIPFHHPKWIRACVSHKGPGYFENKFVNSSEMIATLPLQHLPDSNHP